MVAKVKQLTIKPVIMAPLRDIREDYCLSRHLVTSRVGLFVNRQAWQHGDMCSLVIWCFPTAHMT